ncbi:MAG: translocation/assembly module TamB domain-containing protein [Flavisolibacter sp.]
MQTPVGQNWLAQQVTSRLSRDLQSHLSIKNASIGLLSFNKLDLEGVLMEDQKKDTLLYAGKFQVRITDWFFFRKNAVLKYIGLQDAIIKINRKDSIWNYQYLANYFGSSDTSVKQEAGIQFNLQKILMNNVSFIKKDEWYGNDMVAKIGLLALNANELSVSKKIINIASLHLTNPYFSILDYKGFDTSFAYPGSTTIIDSIDKKNTPDWKFSLGNIKITNGRFRLDKGNYKATSAYFDGQHIDFSNIDGTLKNLGWTKDTIKGALDLSLRERSGFQIKSIKANTTIHPKAMVFENLRLITNKSIIGDYFSMQYKDIRSMDNFLHAVTLDANFNRASVSSDDIAFFAPELKNWKKNIKLEGRVKGSVDALASEDLEIWAGNNTYVHGALSLVGLPNINETLINIEAQELRTTYSDAVSFIPSIRSVVKPNLSKLTYVRFKGNYTGFINDFVTYGTLQTNLGNLQTDLNLKFPASGIAQYSGTVSTAGFQLGQFISSPELGIVDFHGAIKGKGFKWLTLDMNIDGLIHHIGYNGYTYKDITAKGTLKNRLFNGDFIMKDPNANLHLTGLIDLRGKEPVFNVSATVAHADLKALQITNQNIVLQGDFNLNMVGSTLSNMIGSASIRNASLLNNGNKLSFDSLVVTSNYVNGIKKFKASSNEFDATLVGDFNLKNLPDAFTLFLSRYYPAYINPPSNVQPQAFTFDITTGSVDDYIKLVDSNLTGFNNSHLAGSLNVGANTMSLDADIPEFSFKQYHFSDIKLKGAGDFQKLILNGQALNATIGDSLRFGQTNFTIHASGDTSDVSVITTANQAINQANVSAQVRTYSDGLSIIFNPSSFVLSNKTWSIEKGGLLNFRKNTILEGQVKLRESNQEIRMYTELSPIGSWNNLHIDLSNINLGDISPFLVKSNRIEGLVSGAAVIEDPQNKFNITAHLHTEELRLDNDSIGQVETSLNYNNKTGILSGLGNNLNAEHHIDFDMALHFKDSTNLSEDRITLRPTNFELKYLNRYLGDLFSNIQGYVSGTVDILGKGSNQQFLAKAQLRDASLKVNFTQVTYKIDDTRFELRRDTIDLNNIRVRDRFGNTALIKGNITHKAFQDMNFDVEVQTESRQMELLNTTYNDNQQFYGRALGSGSFVLVGPQSDVLMNIDAKASQTDSSFITLPPSKSRETGQANFMVERKYGREMNKLDYQQTTANLKYDIHIDANPLVNIEVILDELTGDAIKARGNGDLRISAGTSTPLTINGRYDIAEGNYLFTFQSFLKKPFILKKGANNFIQWDGDPYGARINLEAVYTAEKVSFAPLTSSLLSSITGVGGSIPNGFRDDVNVVATLTGNLFHPAFSFKLEFPSNNAIYNNPGIAFALQQIEKNQNELNKQVTYLIVFNSFTPYENSSNAGFNPFGEFTYNTISGLFFGEVNKRINQLLSKILRNNNLTFNFTGSLYNRNLIESNSRGGFNINQSNLNLSLGKSFFNDRATFTVGGTFDVPIQSNIQQNIRLFPDVTVDITLNKTGSIKATFFYREDINYLGGVANNGLSTKRYGSSLSYGREFNTIGELLNKKRYKRKHPLADQALPADSTSSH